MPSRFLPIQSGTDPSQQLAIINKNFGELDAESVKKLFYDSNGIPSIQIGVQQDGTSRIRIAKAGVDVTSATDDQLAFNSAQDTFKVIKSGTLTILKAANTEQNSVFINHGFNFVPSHLSYYVDTGFSHQMPFILPNLTSGTMDLLVQAYTTATTFTIFARTPSSGALYGGDLTLTIKYYLYQETAV